MKKQLALSLILIFPLLAACQKEESTPVAGSSSGTATQPQLVRAANGEDLSIPCLTQKAQDIARASLRSMDEAQQLAQTCNVRGLRAASAARGTRRWDWDDYNYYCMPGYSYAAYYNPASYCNGYYYNPGFFSAIYGGAFNYGGYGNGWQLRALGYPFSGYGAYGYSGYGVKNGDFCSSSCMTITDSNQSECSQRCWGTTQLQ